MPGLNLKRLKEHPHGLVLGDAIPVGVLERRLHHQDKRVHLDHPELHEEVARLRAAAAAEDRKAYPLRLIWLRELRSHNSWMHNAPLLMRGERRQTVRVHPDDAAAHGLEDGGTARITSKSGAVEVPVKVTDEMMPGTIALPHGWGHGQPGTQLRVAAERAGVNSNVLADHEALDPLSGTSVLNGIPVDVVAV